MIDTISLKLGNKQYELSFDIDAPANRSWHWCDTDTYLEPGTATVIQLNRLFIQQHAASLMRQMEGFELERFPHVLRAMGASIGDLEQPGLEIALLVLAPERLRERRFKRLP